MVVFAWICSALASVVPLSDVRFDVVVSGPLADIQITQTFVNDSEATIEATYLFPLHEGAVVDRMVMTLDDRTIEGTIQEVEAAKLAYAEAIAAGRTAALTTAERWNLFKQRVGNIPPGAQVEVGLRVIQPVPRVEGVYELVLPLVAGARFVPPGMSDAEALAAPYGGSPVRAHVRVEVDGAVEIDDFACVSHEAFEAPTGEGWSVAATDLAMTHDFVVQWTTAKDEPQVGALHDGEHMLLVFEPPQASAYDDRRPRELVFVVDRSGSMQGPPWQAAIQNLVGAMAGLTPEDQLRLLIFDGTVEVGPSRPATADWVQQQTARLVQSPPGGGTDLAAGLRAALAAPGDAVRQRYVVLVSDGLIANEDQVLAEVDAYRGEAKVFTLGVGGAVNRFVLQEIADRGGGTATWVRDAGTVDAGALLIERIDRPTMSGVVVDWGDWGPLDLAPARLQDVHLGHPVRVLARTRNEEGGPIVVRGVIGREPVEIRVLPRRVERGRAIASAWARARVEWLGRRQVLDGIPARDEGLPLALDYQILSPWTAFLAIDPRERQIRTVSIDVPLGQPGDSALQPSPTVDTQTTTRGVVLTKELLARTPSGRSYEQAMQPASGVYEVAQRRKYDDDQAPTNSMGRDVSDAVVMTRNHTPWGEGPDAPWLERPVLRIGGMGGTTDGLERARATLDLGVPIARDALGVRVQAGVTERVVEGGTWRHVPGRVELLTWDGSGLLFSLQAGGELQRIDAPTSSAFVLDRRAGFASLRAHSGALRLWSSADVSDLIGDPGVDSKRAAVVADLGVVPQDSDQQTVELATRLRRARTAFASEGPDADPLAGTTAAARARVMLGGYGGFFDGWGQIGSQWRGDGPVPLAEATAAVGWRPRGLFTLAVGGGRTIDDASPELALPSRTSAWLALRDHPDRSVRYELKVGWERATGPFAFEVGRLTERPDDAVWRRQAIVGEGSLSSGDRRHGAITGTARVTGLLDRDTSMLGDALAPWVPGLLTAHRPLAGSLDARVTPWPGRYALDLVVAGGVASPLPGVAADRWWAGWQALGQAGVLQHVPLRQTELVAGISAELRQGRPGEPDLDAVDGWLAPDRLGAFGVIGHVTWLLD